MIPARVLKNQALMCPNMMWLREKLPSHVSQSVVAPCIIQCPQLGQVVWLAIG